MDQKCNQSTNQINIIDLSQARDELLDIIEQYMKEIRKGTEYDEIEVDAYYFLGKGEFIDHIQFYLLASVSALRAFTSEDLSDKLKQKIGKSRFFDLCKMLEKMVEFCWEIKGNEMFLAQLDQLMWRSNHITCTVEYIKEIKNKYERLLGNIKDNIS